MGRQKTRQCDSLIGLQEKVGVPDLAKVLISEKSYDCSGDETAYITVRMKGSTAIFLN